MTETKSVDFLTRRKKPVCFLTTGTQPSDFETRGTQPSDFSMIGTKPSDFLPLKTWFLEYGKPAFNSDKMLHYHTKPIQKELIQAGAMARVGVHIFLHKTRFWPEYQRIIAESMTNEG